jgi:hypothetical protein
MLGGLGPVMVGLTEGTERKLACVWQWRWRGMLLHWSTLHPAGPSNLAALRFSSPVRVRSLRIFPKDAHPFVEQPEIVS